MTALAQGAVGPAGTTPGSIVDNPQTKPMVPPLRANERQFLETSLVNDGEPSAEVSGKFGIGLTCARGAAEVP